MLSAGAALWLIPLLAAGLLATRDLRAAAAVVAAALALSIPTLLDVRFLDSPAASTVTDTDRLANLFEPLDVAQLLGCRRGRPAVAPALAAPDHRAARRRGVRGAGELVAWRRRSAPLLIYVAAACTGCAMIVALGSAWVDAKALATASPAPLLAGAAGGAALLRTGRRVEHVLLAAIAGGVLWSNALAYRDVSLTPHARFDELRAIGHRITGPT